uniref:BPL/LPL catalytic domain-containing protein n=1 Tax=Amblyomma maculatum TaxID=34609 RepID=G3MTB7_AMBMU
MRTLASMLRTLKRSSASLTNRLPAFLNDEKRAKVLVSSSRCIYRNLALEQWLYENATFSPGSPGILLMWWNGPAVVIGRHQNPWVECSLNAVAKFGVTLARRNSGGGTVYHDTGNLNCCFMGHKRDYNRKENLQFIADALNASWGVHCTITDRDDVIVQDAFKISGTAAKIGHQKAYHHCTILVDVNTTILHQVLGGRCSNIESKATSSVRASVKNLKELCPHLTIETLSASLAARFNSQHQEHATKTRSDNCIHLINPSEDHFPGINAMCEKLQGWDWIFGCTPRFTIRGSFPTPTSCTGVLDLGDALGRNEVLKVELKCYHGQIEDVRLVPTLRRHGLLQAVMDEICGTRFVQSEIAEVFRRIKDSDP